MARLPLQDFFGAGRNCGCEAVGSTQNFYLLSPKVNAEISAIHCVFFALQPHLCFKNKHGRGGEGHEHYKYLSAINLLLCKLYPLTNNGLLN